MPGMAGDGRKLPGMAGDGWRDGRYRTPAHTHTLFSKEPFKVIFLKNSPKEKAHVRLLGTHKSTFLTSPTNLMRGIYALRFFTKNFVRNKCTVGAT